MLEEVNENTFRSHLERGQVIAFFHTPFCAACKLAEKKISVVLELLKPNCRSFSCNLNLMPSLAETFEITSVPCLIFIENGKVKKRIFNFESLQSLQELFVQLSNK